MVAPEIGLKEGVCGGWGTVERAFTAVGTLFCATEDGLATRCDCPCIKRVSWLRVNYAYACGFPLYKCKNLTIPIRELGLYMALHRPLFIEEIMKALDYPWYEKK